MIRLERVNSILLRVAKFLLGVITIIMVLIVWFIFLMFTLEPRLIKFIIYAVKTKLIGW